ncbi:unnamed protein product [Rangifer tarandus platyrhynchus]|uniref:Uncharacterized protein n=1 Tax=Rangifer tarandus platyrhynchus TaxID=3082113 RepID=A0AC59YI82_RANTA
MVVAALSLMSGMNSCSCFMADSNSTSGSPESRKSSDKYLASDSLAKLLLSSFVGSDLCTFLEQAWGFSSCGLGFALSSIKVPSSESRGASSELLPGTEKSPDATVLSRDLRFLFLDFFLRPLES